MKLLINDFLETHQRFDSYVFDAQRDLIDIKTKIDNRKKKKLFEISGLLSEYEELKKSIESAASLDLKVDKFKKKLKSYKPHGHNIVKESIVQQVTKDRTHLSGLLDLHIRVNLVQLRKKLRLSMTFLEYCQTDKVVDPELSQFHGTAIRSILSGISTSLTNIDNVYDRLIKTFQNVVDSIDFETENENPEIGTKPTESKATIEKNSSTKDPRDVEDQITKLSETNKRDSGIAFS